MTLPSFTPPVTPAVARVLKTRRRDVIEDASPFAGVDVTLSVTPNPAYASRGDFDTYPYGVVDLDASNLVAGPYMARAEGPGIDLLWAGAVTASGDPLAVHFDDIPVPVGSGYTIALAPQGQEALVAWRSDPFSVLPVLGLSSTGGADPLDLALTITGNDPAIATVALDWGDGATDPNAALGDHTHHYTAAGTYTIEAIGKDAGGLDAGVAMLVVTVQAITLNVWVDPDVVLGVHLAATLSSEIAPAQLTADWGDGSHDLHMAVEAGDMTHTYAAPGNYLVTVTADTGDTATTFVTVEIPAAVQAETE